MTNAQDPLQEGFVRMIHPDTGNIADMAEGSTGLFYAAGWVDLTDENAPPAEAEAEPPEPMTEAEARDAREGTEAAGGEATAPAHKTAGGRSRRPAAASEE